MIFIMKLYYISDLHLECLVTQNGVNQEILERDFYPLFQTNNKNETNILLLGGDICTAKHLHYFVPFFEKIVTDYGFNKVFYIAGNHEFYGATLSDVNGIIKNTLSKSNFLKDKMFYLDNDVVDLNDEVQLVATTLWYQVPSSYHYPIEQALNDFQKIKICQNNKYSKIHYPDIEKEYLKNLSFIKNALQTGFEKNKKTVLFTHHACNISFVKGTKYEDNPDNTYGYGTSFPIQWQYEYGQYLEQIIACVHGHSHRYAPHVYQDELGLTCYQNTLGYYDYEYFPNSEKGLKLKENGLKTVFFEV